MNIGILAQKKEKQIDGINRVTLETLKEIRKIDKSNHFSFIGNTDWLNMDMDYFDIIPDTRNMMDLDYVAKFGKFDIIHSYYRPFIFSNNIDCAKILTIYDMIVLKNKLSIFNYFDVPVRKCAENVDAIITISESSKRDIIECYNIPPDKIKVIYIGAYNKGTIDYDSISDNIKKITQKRYIVAVSTMREYKNIDGLVDAFLAYKDIHKKDEIKLVLVGKNDMSTDIGKFIAEAQDKCKDIILTGYVTDNELSFLYKNCLASAFVSLYEGFGLPVLESMSFGKTVICSNRSSLPEVGGNAVEYCNPESKDSIVGALENIVLNEKHRQQLEEVSLIQASKFSYEKTAKETIELYKTLV